MTVDISAESIFNVLQLLVQVVEVLTMSMGMLADGMGHEDVPLVILIIVVPALTTAVESFFCLIKTLAEVVQGSAVDPNMHLKQTVLRLEILDLLLGFNNVDVKFTQVDVKLINGLLGRKQLPLQFFNSLLTPLDGPPQRPVLVGKMMTDILNVVSLFVLRCNIGG